MKDQGHDTSVCYFGQVFISTIKTQSLIISALSIH